MWIWRRQVRRLLRVHFIQYLVNFQTRNVAKMKGIMVLLLISGVTHQSFSFLYYPNIKDLKEFTNIDFEEKPKEKETSTLDPLDLENNPDVQLLIKYMYWRMKQDEKTNLKKEGTLKKETNMRKETCIFLCRIWILEKQTNTGS